MQLQKINSLLDVSKCLFSYAQNQLYGKIIENLTCIARIKAPEHACLLVLVKLRAVFALTSKSKIFIQAKIHELQQQMAKLGSFRFSLICAIIRTDQ